MATPTKFRPVRLDLADPGHIRAVEFICNNLRPEDRFEFAAVDLDPTVTPHLIPLLVQNGGEAYIIVHKHDPVFVWGVQRGTPGIYHIWGFGTSATRRIIPRFTRWLLDEWLPDFTHRVSPRRIEVRVPVDSAHSVKWLPTLGLKPETVMPNYGVNKEAFLQLALTIETKSNVHIQTTGATANGYTGVRGHS